MSDSRANGNCPERDLAPAPMGGGGVPLAWVTLFLRRNPAPSAPRRQVGAHVFPSPLGSQGEVLTADLCHERSRTWGQEAWQGGRRAQGSLIPPSSRAGVQGWRASTSATSPSISARRTSMTSSTSTIPSCPIASGHVQGGAAPLTEGVSDKAA